MTTRSFPIRKAWVSVTVIACAALAGITLYLHLNPAPPISGAIDAVTGNIPHTVPEFTLKDSNGVLRSSHEWQGKSLVINFWATWCPPCLREIPLLQSLHSTREITGLEIIGIAIDRPEAVLAYREQVGLEYPVLIGEQEALEVAALFGIEAVALPFTVFADARGRIVTLHLGELRQDELAGIVSVVRAVNEGEMTLAQARRRIAQVSDRVNPAD